MVMHSGHEEWIKFDVAPLGRHQIILGMPWIAMHNPSIDWKAETIVFNRYECPGTHRIQHTIKEIEYESRREVCATSENE